MKPLETSDESTTGPEIFRLELEKQKQAYRKTQGKLGAVFKKLILNVFVN